MKKWFNFSAGVILLITGTAKILNALGHAPILQRVDPIFPIQFNHLMLLAGFLELLVACICFINKFRILGHIVTAWLATSFLIYRVGLWAVGWHKPCSCLGNLTDALHISPHTADTVMKIILAYLLIGSYASLFWLWRQRKIALQVRVATPNV